MIYIGKISFNVVCHVVLTLDLPVNLVKCKKVASPATAFVLRAVLR